MYDYSGLLELAQTLKCEIVKDFPLSAITSFKVGGPADVLAKPVSADDAIRLWRWAKQENVKVLILGKASNVLISDQGFKGLVISTGAFKKLELLPGNKIECGAGVSLSALCNFALKNSLTGLEFAYGIPGSAGGAAYMNAGAYGGEMKDVLVSCKHVEALKSDFLLGNFSGDELELSYRNSVYKNKPYLITSLTLQLKQGEASEIKAKMDDYMHRRIAKQPLEFPSGGSIFKRPPDDFAGRLIEICGLKGYSIGGAQVSEKHAGFIINTGKATSKDIKDLISFVQESVRGKTGVLLETEIVSI
ncbi:MAG: UDP-N-acetylmuramate dehydrogenase [Clostridiales bacterium]|nr:UDP-N-acetylmuramate dehydrogenase [Clostridiales bacterium]